ATFSPDGALLITASHDQTARVWDAATGIELRSLIGHEGWVVSANIGRSGKYILTASHDGTARVWSNLSITEQVALGRTRVFRQLTQLERDQYGLPDWSVQSHR